MGGIGPTMGILAQQVPRLSNGIGKTAHQITIYPIAGDFVVGRDGRCVILVTPKTMTKITRKLNPTEMNSAPALPFTRPQLSADFLRLYCDDD
jgi:hypothetical protein